ncbi:E3 ubiquitin-protein ligase RNF167 [Fopius arisanus]|uniref:E3 ubiquitin-protein ligase RNF167 n=1 Tax=Fopius arisanus TaxID=64838 RepID=A0A0C9QY57_9HYME|nr:PREDICTED: E3 ubiquitin-protein ligase RNF167-like [Fopius arisanus]
MSVCCRHRNNLLWLMVWTICCGYTNADILVFSAAARHQIEEELRDAPARFGPLIPSDGIKGVIAYADPPTACTVIAPPPKNTSYNGNWIALIARYNCSFEIKIRMAQEAGYDAAIVHNVNSNELEPMSAKDPIGIIIPSVFVSEISGLIIKAHYLYNRHFFVVINDDVPFNINTHLLLPFAIVVGICFLAMVIFMVVRCIKDRRRQHRHRLPNSSLKKIPTHKYTKGDPYETCAICLDDYAEGEKLRVLPCAHAYHTKCIDPWLTKNKRVCPVCKRKVFAADERVLTDTESDSDGDDTTPLIRDGHQGTQGGTFMPQRENPFSRVRRTLSRQNSDASNASEDVPPYLNQFSRWGQNLGQPESSTSDSSGESFISLFTSGESRSTTANTPGTNTFLVSDSHSINGDTTHIERSTSSTKPHTVTLCNEEAEEQPARTVIVTSTQSSTEFNDNSSHDLVV